MLGRLTQGWALGSRVSPRAASASCRPVLGKRAPSRQHHSHWQPDSRALVGTIRVSILAFYVSSICLFVHCLTFGYYLDTVEP
jgi:hypothetical protein